MTFARQTGLILAIAFTVGCRGDTAEPPPSNTMANAVAPKTRPVEREAEERTFSGALVLAEERWEAPVRTGVVQWISVRVTTTAAGLDALMRALYNAGMARTDFQFPVNSYRAFFYHYGVDPAKHGTAWIGRISQDPGSPLESENLLRGDVRLNQARKILLYPNGLEAIDGGIRLETALDSKGPGARRIGDAMMFAVFYTASLVFPKIAVLDSLEQVLTYNGETIGRVVLSRKVYDRLGLPKALERAKTAAAKRKVYRKLINRLPAGTVDIDSRYAP